MEEEECRASPRRAKRREGAREGLGGGHDVSSGMPGTQLCAWLPGEDDRREEGGLGRLGRCLGAR